jgi:hypothetical protein
MRFPSPTHSSNSGGIFMVRKEWSILLLVAAAVFSSYAATVSGTIFDAICEKPIVGVKIMMSDSTATAVASTKTDVYGHYSIYNVRYGNYVLVASAIQEEYPLTTMNISVAESSVTQDLLLSPMEGTGTLQGRVSNDGTLEIVASRTGLLLRNFNENGTISIYSANGKLLYRNSIVANTSSLELPGNITAHGVYLVKINQKGSTFCKQILRP